MLSNLKVQDCCRHPQHGITAQATNGSFQMSLPHFCNGHPISTSYLFSYILSTPLSPLLCYLFVTCASSTTLLHSSFSYTAISSQMGSVLHLRRERDGGISLEPAFAFKFISFPRSSEESRSFVTTLLIPSLDRVDLPGWSRECLARHHKFGLNNFTNVVIGTSGRRQKRLSQHSCVFGSCRGHQ